MAANNLKLQLILSALDKVTGPLKKMQGGSIGAARALKEARDQLKELNTLQSDISTHKKQRTAVRETSESLAKAQQRLREMREELKGMTAPTEKFQKSFFNASKEVERLSKKHQEQRTELQRTITKFKEAGISTSSLKDREKTLGTEIDAVNRKMKIQKDRLAAITKQQERLARAKSQHQKTQALAGGMAASGAGGVATGYAISRPLVAIVNAFAPAENAATQLRVAMMDQNGQVAADFQRITDLATSLGDRLPGTTADFQDMMTMLRRQGISAQSILGGTGEAAAYLGVQLQKPVADAAEFAAKMQDATRTTEADMMSLMDTIQRAYYLGVDDNNMLQGFSKISPVMDIIKKQGLEAANVFAPLLVMMDQTGMAGESAGNAFRKVFQGAMNTAKIDKVLDGLKAEKGIGLKLNFTDGKGEFAGIENLYSQLQKLQSLTTEDRLGLIKDLWGDDSETLQVLNTMMNKGIAGYDEVAAKMQAQADLRTRVNEQLGTLTNVIEAAQGSWTNAMSEIGASVAPQLKELIEGLGNVAVRVKTWVTANPALTAQIFKTVAGLGLLMTVMGSITLALASILGPFAMVRFAMMLLGIKSLGLVTALKFVASALLWIARLALANPIGLLITVLAGGAYLIYQNWDAVKAYMAGLWAELKAGFSGGIGNMIATLLNFSPLGLFYRAFAGVLSYFGIELPSKFTDFGSMLMDGMVRGITEGLGRVKEAITGAGGAAIGWFKEKLGIHSPSRVFAELGGFTMAGLGQGLAAGEGGVLKQLAGTAKSMTDAGTGMLTSGVSFDTRAPISARGNAPSSAAAAPITINIYPAAGQDAAAIGREVQRQLAAAQQQQQARQRSRFGDQE